MPSCPLASPPLPRCCRLLLLLQLLCHYAACRLHDEGIHLLGTIPEDKLLRAVRLDEVQTALDAEFSFGSRVQLDQVCDSRA